MQAKRRVLLIGWDAADWKSITPLVDSGKMPNLQRLIDGGVMGNLATIQPVLSPMLWTSIATGKRPYKHGIHGFSEPDPASGGIRPITNLSRKTKAFWNILNQVGLKTNVVGWWPSHPAEPVNGVMVSNHFQQATKALDEPWPMRPGTVHPVGYGAALEEMRVHPWELEGDMLRLFVPKAPEIDQEKDKRLLSCAKIIAEASGVHAAATKIMTDAESPGKDWDFMAVYYDAIDHFGHGFMKYHPPRQDWVSEEDFEMYQDVVESGYRFHDLMLGTLLQLAGEDTTVILISDHGFHPDALRPHHIPNEPAGPAAEHRPFGIFVAHGPGIKEDDLVFGASLLDVAPTILAHFGLPVGRDMDGRALTSIFRETPEVETVETWDAIDAEEGFATGEHPPDAQLDPVEAQEAIDQLVALGYIDEPDEDKDQAIKDTVGELKYNLARAYVDGNRDQEAAALFEELWEEWPEESRYGVHLFQCQLALEYVVDARRTFDLIKERKQTYARLAAEELKELRERIVEEQNAAAREEEGGGADGEEDEDGTIDMEKVDRRTQGKMRRLRGRAGINQLAFLFLEGSLLHAEGEHAEAVSVLKKAAAAEPHRLQSLYQKIGEAQLAMRKPDDAEASFRKALEFDGINPHARLGLARAHLRRQRHGEAAEEALAAAGQLYHNPRAHYLAGVALNRLGDTEQARLSIETALLQNPVFPAAHRSLAGIYQDKLGDWERAAEHRRLAREARQRIRAWKAGERFEESREEVAEAFVPRRGDGAGVRMEIPDRPPELSSEFPGIGESVVVVSGLPRSGTSMLMQMLQAGGLDVFSDGAREADESNLRGYLEHERVKSLGREDPGWLRDARGKAVKVVAPLLPRLPAALVSRDGGGDAAEAVPMTYRVLIMERPLEEIVASQGAMLERLGKREQGARLDPARLANTFRLQFNQVGNLVQAWMGHRPDRVTAMRVSYHEALEDAAGVAARVNAFLGGGLDEAAMAGVVEPEMRRAGGEW